MSEPFLCAPMPLPLSARLARKTPATHGSGAFHKQRSSPQLTRTGAITGTPLYVAPELSDRRAHLTPAVDVFSIGVVAYKMLVGRLPHVEPRLLARLAGRKIPSVPPVASLRSGLGRELALAFDACLDVDPMVWCTIRRWLRRKHQKTPMRTLHQLYGWHKPRGRMVRWKDGDVVPFPLATVRVCPFRLGWQRTPDFASTSMESPVRNERRTPGSVRGARKPARGQPG